jgi:hypothetical protein
MNLHRILGKFEGLLIERYEFGSEQTIIDSKCFGRKW